MPLLVVWLAAVSSQLEQHEEEGAGWEVREQGSGQTEDLLEPDEEEVNYCKFIIIYYNIMGSL